MIGTDPASGVVGRPDRFVTIARAGALVAAPPPGAGAPSRRRTALDGLFAPVDAASLAVFRIAFGGLLLWEVWKFVANGWIARYYVDPAFHFTYYGFEWVRPLHGQWMYVHFLVLGVLAACIALGACYRLAAGLIFLGLSYVFLLEQARYLNHLYLVCLLGFLLTIVPAHRALSFDGWLRPHPDAGIVPAWALWLLRFQVAVPYVYGGIAKLNGDWLAGEPIRSWLAERSAQSMLGPALNQEWVVYTICYGGLLFDLAIVPLLLWRRTRAFALVAALAFHLTNAYLFTIGIFPWLMIAATLLFLPPDWPRRFGTVGSRTLTPQPPLPAAGEGERAGGQSLPRAQRGDGRAPRVILAMLAVYVMVQLLVPLRHLLYPGEVAWTEEGHRFSWRMRLREKEQTVELLVTAPSTGLDRQLDPRQFVTAWQHEGMEGRPDMLLQLAHHVAQRARQQGHPDVEVRVRALTSLNRRPAQDQIDPTVDLATRPRSIWPADWILPLQEPR
ncbi:MAG TPA: HTTM domain-containing protein [Chloroflexota bacterium]|nr:HTTM domain-containing protein [Chloroflexota bacterium]